MPHRASVWIGVTVVIAGCLLAVQQKPDGQVPQVTLTFEGTSTGGELCVAAVGRRTSPYVCITNYEGDAGDVLAGRLVSAEMSTGLLRTRGRAPLGIVGNTVVFPGYGYGRQYAGQLALGGTERGYGIPLPILDLTANYDYKTDAMTLRWSNSGEYTAIAIQRDDQLIWRYHGVLVTNDQFIDKHILGKNNVDPNEINYTVVPYKGDLPSGGAFITASLERQEELSDSVFVDGVTPNWRRWNGLTNGRSSIRCEKGLKHSVVRGPWYDKPDQNPSYQSVTIQRGVVNGGIRRQFLDLSTSNAYVVTIRMNTFEMEINTNLTVTVHVAWNPDRGTMLPDAQLDGNSARILGGQKGSTLAEYGRTHVTGGRWEASRARLVQWSEVFPEKVGQERASLTVWIHIQGVSEAETRIGMDWISVARDQGSEETHR